MSPRPPPKISYKDNCMCDLDSDIAGSSKDTQRIQPKPTTQLSITGRPVCGQESTKEIEKRTMFVHYHVWSRHSQSRETWWSHRPNKYGETRVWSVACWHLHVLKKIKQERWDQYWWIKKRSTKLISEYKDCHMQLWKKQNISEFKSLWKRSKIMLIETHFMPICSRITFSTHSAKIRRRWSAKWVMWSYSSCAKLYQKYNVLTVFFIGIKELCTALADNAWLTANPEESFTNSDWMHSLSRTTW